MDYFINSKNKTNEFVGISVSINITLHLITHRVKMKFIPMHIFPNVFKTFLIDYSLYHKKIAIHKLLNQISLSKCPTLYFIRMLVCKRGPEVSGPWTYTCRSVLDLREANFSPIWCNSPWVEFFFGTNNIFMEWLIL